MTLLPIALALAALTGPTFTPSATRAPFSQAVQVGDILYLSGQIGSGDDGKLAPGVDGQAHQVMRNIKHVVEAHGRSMDDVFKCTVMMADISRWAEFNAVYVTYFKPDRLPTRSAFGSTGLVAGALMEVECWAYAPAEHKHR